jgi:hypothetical protein
MTLLAASDPRVGMYRQYYLVSFWVEVRSGLLVERRLITLTSAQPSICRLLFMVRLTHLYLLWLKFDT